MGVADSYCSGDPSQDAITAQTKPTRYVTENCYNNKETLPQESQSNLNVPSNNDEYNSDDSEESLQATST